MSELNPQVEEVVTKLVAWEVFDRSDFDPKILLRSIPLPDLSILVSNIQSEKSPEECQGAVISMIMLEHQYRLGHIVDWTVEIEEGFCNIRYELLKPLKYVCLNLTVDPQEKAC